MYKELEEHSESHAWVQYLPTILKTLNERTIKKPYKEVEGTEGVLCKETECEVIPVGTLVRVAMDVAKSFEGRKVDTKFRSGDVRWSLYPHKITNILMYPRQPIRYVVSGIHNNTFSKNQLQIYKGDKSGYLKKKGIERILKKRKKKGRIEYLVMTTDNIEEWKPLSELKKTVKLMVEHFEEEHASKPKRINRRKEREKEIEAKEVKSIDENKVHRMSTRARTKLPSRFRD